MSELSNILSKLSSEYNKTEMFKIRKRELFKSLDDSIIVLNTDEMRNLKKEKEIYVSPSEPLVVYEDGETVPLNKFDSSKNVDKLVILDRYLKGRLQKRLNRSELFGWEDKITSENYCYVNDLYTFISDVLCNFNLNSNKIRLHFENDLGAVVSLNKNSIIKIQYEDFSNLDEHTKLDVLSALYCICDMCTVYINSIDVRSFIENDVKVDKELISYLMPRLFIFNEDENMLSSNKVNYCVRKAYRKILEGNIFVNTLINFNNLYGPTNLYIFIKDGRKVRLTKAIKYNFSADAFMEDDLEIIGG